MVAVTGSAVTGDGSAGFAIGHLRDGLEIGTGVVSAGCLRAFLASEVGVGPADVAERVEVALRLESLEGSIEAAEASLEGEALAVSERLEVVGRDELVLGAIDEGDELVEPVVGVAAAAVVEQRQVAPDVAQEQELADAIEHVGLGRQPRVGGRLGEHAVTEAVEVADGKVGTGGGADPGLEALSELLGGLDVVGEHEDLLGQQGTGERFGRRLIRAQPWQYQTAVRSLGRSHPWPRGASARDRR